MVLPLLFAALAPQVLTGMSPLLASSIGAGVGGAVETGDLEKGLLAGLGAFAGGAVLPKVMSAVGGGSAAAAVPTAANASQAAAAGLPQTAAMPPPPRPANLGAGGGGMFSQAMDFAKSPVGMGVGIGAAAGPALGAGLFSKGDDSKKSRSEYGSREPTPIPRIPTMPGAGYRPGRDGEFDYGISTPYGADAIMGYTDRGVLPYAGGGMLQRMANPQLPGLGPVRLAGGGIVALAGGGPAEGGAPNAREVISAAVAAVKGQHPQPEIALGAFLAMFGEEALRQLVDSVQGGEMDDTAQRFSEGENGEVKGPGDGSGVDDMVPAKMDDGSGDVLLSDGEFVMRKDAVDSLERKFGGGFLDSVNKAGPRAAEAAASRMAGA